MEKEKIWVEESEGDPRVSFNGNSNIGLYAFCNDYFCLLGKEAEGLKKAVEKRLEVPVLECNVAGTGMIGVFVTGNSKAILLPSIIFDDEEKAIREFIREINKKNNTDFKVFKIKTKLTCLGNNIICNDDGGIASPEYPKEEVEAISSSLGVPFLQKKVAGVEVVGAVIAINKKYGLLHRDASEEEVKEIEKHLKIKITLGTVNMGSPYIKAGIICNSKGFIMGKNSGGPEAVNAEEGLGYLKGQEKTE